MLTARLVPHKDLGCPPVPWLPLFTALGLGRVLWGWHSGGIKWADAQDLAKWTQTHLSPSQVLSMQLACLLVTSFVSWRFLPQCSATKCANDFGNMVDNHETTAAATSLSAQAQSMRMRVVGVYLPGALINISTVLIASRMVWTACASGTVNGYLEHVCALELFNTRQVDPHLAWAIYALLGAAVLLPMCTRYLHADGGHPACEFPATVGSNNARTRWMKGVRRPLQYHSLFVMKGVSVFQRSNPHSSRSMV